MQKLEAFVQIVLRDFGGIPRQVANEPPVALLDTAGCREIERRVMEQFGYDEIDLVRRAGAAAFALLKQRWPECRSLSVFCGKGNNAADGYIIAALAARSGWKVEILCLEPPPTADPGLTAHQEALAAGAVQKPLYQAADHSDDAIGGDVIVDALLGTGLKGSPRPPYAKQIVRINRTKLPVLALDVPSGLNATTAEQAGEAVKASATISFIVLKRALVTGWGVNLTGHLYLDDLGVPARLSDAATNRLPWLTAGDCAALPMRQPAAHKGENGRVLLIGGAAGFGGAIILSAEMAVRGGAGLVAVATDAAHCAPLLARVPEALAKPSPQQSELTALLDWADVVACGPGLDTSMASEQFLTSALTAEKPLILDADALNMLAASPVHQKYLKARAAPNCFTPHPGEAARLLGCSISEVEANRITAALTLAKRYQALVALKGAGTILAAESTVLGICAHGNPGMASAGMGDILCGLLAALIAQGLAPRQALTKAVCLHALAADQLASHQGTIGIAAGELVAPIRTLLNTPATKDFSIKFNNEL